MDISITKREQSLITLEKLKEILFYDPIGLRDTPEEAFELYKEAAIKYHGEFARF